MTESQNTSETEAPVNLLMVEDNPGDVRIAQEAFRQCSGSIALHVVGDGEAALDFLHQRGAYAGSPNVNMILLDLNLPKKDGREVLAEIKKDPLLRRIPVAILTTSSSEEDIQSTYDLHANCYLTKPVSFEKFVSLVRSLQSFWFGSAMLPSSNDGLG
jgi:CheY-like chemotaxis protein